MIFTTPLEVARTGFNELFRDGFVTSSAADLRAATLCINVWVANTSLDSSRAFRKVFDAIVGRLSEVDELSYIWRQATFDLRLAVINFKLFVGMQVATFLVEIKQPLGNKRQRL